MVTPNRQDKSEEASPQVANDTHEEREVRYGVGHQEDEGTSECSTEIDKE